MTTTTGHAVPLHSRVAAYGGRPLDHGFVVEGLLQRAVGLTLEASGCQLQIGARCLINRPEGGGIEAEVVGFAGERTFLMPTGDMDGLVPRARVRPLPGAGNVQVGEAMLGRVIDGAGMPLDGKPAPRTDHQVPLTGLPINPLIREPVTEPLDVGVRAINGLLTVGRGQRIGLFAGSGVGKSTLLGMMTRFTAADVIVVGLIGERGREVRDFVSKVLGDQGIKRAVVIATPADRPPLMRIRGAWLATAVAEHFRDQGKQVLLLMDSLTRFAQAQREVGLAVGEPPTTRGYPPSVFTRIPQLVERAGTSGGKGAITGIYTVLTEGDDPNDPVADTARAILDGHIMLSREVAEAGRYPAIDIESSVSRLANDIVSPRQAEAAHRFRQLYSRYTASSDLIQLGAYKKGTDPDTDLAIAKWPGIRQYLSQGRHEPASLADCERQLQALLQPAEREAEVSHDAA
jgi:flagellum-specific ATP synthase